MPYNSACAADGAMASCVVDHVLKQCLRRIAASAAASTDCQGNRHTTRFQPTRNQTPFFSLLQLAVVPMIDRRPRIQQLKNPDRRILSGDSCEELFAVDRQSLQSPFADNTWALPSGPKRPNKGSSASRPPPMQVPNSSISRISRAQLRLSGPQLLDQKYPSLE